MVSVQFKCWLRMSQPTIRIGFDILYGDDEQVRTVSQRSRVIGRKFEVVNTNKRCLKKSYQGRLAEVN